MPDILSLAKHWVTCLREFGELTRPLPMIRVSVVDHATFSAQIVPGERPRIEVSSDFVAQLDEDIRSDGEALLDACLGGFEPPGPREDAVACLCEAVAETQLSIVLLHELFHVLSGHLGRHVAVHGSDTRLDEISLGVEEEAIPSTPAETELETLKAYYQEFEADNSAVEAILQLTLPTGTRELLECYVGDEGNPLPEANARVSQLTQDQELVIYRLLLIAGWKVIREFERRRGAALHQRAAAHPLPGARLLAHLQTLVEVYGGHIVPKTGDRLLDIDEQREQRLRFFFEQVFTPTLLVGWPESDSSAVAEGFEATPLTLAKETLHLFTSNHPENPPWPRARGS